MASLTWMGLNPTASDEDAYAAAMKMWGLPPSFIRLNHTGGALLMRPNGKTIEDDLTEFIKEKYPPPEYGDEFFDDYEMFGYWVYVVKSYPDVWAARGVTFAQMFENQRQDFYWEKIEEQTGPLGDASSALEQFLRGNSVVALKAPMLATEGQEGTLDDEGVAVWKYPDGKMMCIFTDAEDNMIPRLMYPSEVEITDYEFDGW